MSTAPDILPRVACALALLASALTGSGPARAEPAHEEKVLLRVLACEPSFAAELRRIAGLELGALLYEGSGSEAGECARLDVRCEPELARVAARDARGTQEANNDVRFDAFPGDAAPRAVALAAVELLRAVDPALAARIEAQRAVEPAAPEAARGPAAELHAAPEAEPAAARPTADSAPKKARASTQVMLGAVVRRFVSEPHTTVWGARAELSRRSALRIDYGFDLEGALGEHNVELGVIEARLLSSAAWIGWRVGSGDWSLTAGGGGRIGVANFEGSSPDPAVLASQSARVWAGPLALVRGEAAWGGFSLALAVEAGWAAAGAEGLSRGTTAVAARGAWLALALGPGIRF